MASNSANKLLQFDALTGLQPGNLYSRRMLGTVDLCVPNSLDQLLFYNAKI
jgi:hypothetical protein